MTYSKDLTRKPEGILEIQDFPNLKFSTIEIGEETFPVGDPIFNPYTGFKERLPGEPELNTITLMTPESPFARSEFEKVKKATVDNPRRIFTLVYRRAGQTKIYQGRLSSITVDIGMDKDSPTSSADKLSMTLELTRRDGLT
jgi:hypothetical protein